MEATTVEATQVEMDSAPEPSRIEQAAEAIEVASAEAEPAAEEAEPAAEEAEPAAEPEAETEEPAAEEAVNVGHEYKTLRRRQRQLKRKEEAFENKVQALEAKMADLEQQTDLIRLIKEDPESALQQFTTRAGTSPDDFYEQLTTKRLGGEFEEEGNGALWNEMKNLREEIKARDAQAEEAKEMQAQRTHEARIERAVESHVGELCGIPDSPEFAERWTNLANLRPDILEARAKYAVHWAMENSPKTTLPELADALDEVVGEEYKFTLDRLNASRQDQSTPELNSEGQGAPELGKPAAKPQALTLTNNDAAVTSRRARTMTQSERLQAAANALPDFKALVGN
jgi:hypothetical protein